MAYQRVSDPFAETFQDNRWNTRGAWSGTDDGPRRSAPVEPPFREQINGQWWQGNQRLHGYKAPMYFVRPRDGRRKGTAGRLKDGLTGEGPDVFVMKCGDRRTFMRDRPQRWQWSGWPLDAFEKQQLAFFDKDFRPRDLFPFRDLWRSNENKRSNGRYDFENRRYKHRRYFDRKGAPFYYTDARYKDGARRRDPPMTFRDGNGRWFSSVEPDAGDWPGGRPRNPW